MTMLEPKFIRDNAAVVKDTLKKRQMTDRLTLVDDWLRYDQEWRELKGLTDQLRARRNQVSEEINKLKKAKKDAGEFIQEAKDIPQKIKANDDRMAELATAMHDVLSKLPNVLHDSVPVGKSEADNKEILKFGKKPTFKFEPMSHVDLAEKQGWIDMDRAAKLSGSRWYFMQGELARLEMAVSMYAVDLLTKKGFRLTVPPFMLGTKAYEGVTDLGAFKDALYKIEGEELHMIATSEHPLTALFMDETVDAAALPLKMAGFSTCFRKEAGAHGKDQKGIFRVHQFNKVEQVVYALPEQAWKIHEEMRQNMQDFFESLGLHGHIITLCSADTGVVMAKTYDAECWFPAQSAFRETGSCSNAATYQSAALNIRYTKGEEKGFVHTLNSTMVATTRALVAIMESFQNADGTVNVPAVLQPYMNGVKKIGKKIR
jgi:seryl-tRNA synthetase